MSLSKYNKTTKELEPIAGGFDVQGILDDIGDLTDLDTSTKTDLVSAVNEVKSDIPTKNSDLTNDSGFVGLGETATTAYAGNKGKANAEAIEAMVNVNGACNLCPNDMQSGSQQDVIYTVNSDDTISLAGTALITIDRNVTERAKLKAGSYKVSGCPVGGGESTYLLMVYSDTTHQYITFDSGSGASFTLASDSTILVTLRVYGGANVDGKVFKPMIYDARLNPTGYVPYAMTNRELTERFAVVTGTTESDTNITSIPYPQGFTRDNTFIVTLAIYISSRWYQYNNTNTFYAVTINGGIEVVAEDSTVRGKPIKLLLMRA